VLISLCSQYQKFPVFLYALLRYGIFDNYHLCYVLCIDMQIRKHLDHSHGRTLAEL
jgi:hypothetical protein